jgi:predicted membrane protein
MAENNNVSNNSNGSNNSRVLAGLFIIGIGVLFFLKQTGLNLFPYWIFSWPMILIAVGIFSGIKNNFRGSGWIVLLILGSFFLLDDVLKMYSLRPYLVPAILVGVGVMLIVRPKNDMGWRGRRGRRGEWRQWDRWGSFDKSLSAATDAPASQATDYANTETGSGDTTAAEKLDATAIFGAVKKTILSKNFTGGQAVSIFGGSEIDLSKADINGTVIVDVTAILGGVKLIVPSHWTVRQDIAAIFGGVEDKRDTRSVITVQNKILVLKGTAFMGGIEITSYY